MMNFGLQGQTVVITGGGSGIGAATARRLVRDGAHVALIDRSAEALEAVLPELRAIDPAALGIVADVCDQPAMEAAAERIIGTLGVPTGLVASAGISWGAKAEKLALEDLDRVLRVNVQGVLISCQVFGRPMIEQKKGSIVVIGSIAGLAGQPGRAAYCASKFAVHGLVKTMALEWGRHQVRVNSIAPTMVDTPLLHLGVPATFIDVALDRTPMQRIAQADDIASVALTLLSDAMAYVSGVVLPVDGGLTAGLLTHRSGADLSSKRLLAAGDYDEGV